MRALVASLVVGLIDRPTAAGGCIQIYLRVERILRFLDFLFPMTA